ncbi:phosphoribosylaminoimidazole synthetase [Gracilibacillus halophilus YIM-C55.5]|uniref:Phosphoribosylformylglycinamidine cyclo-ligase n=1 Tax=Gracilibacillus halophilus YIM-C55.5 TaxID=1308866 RepID=N4W8Z1_9BACI|nr:phosphoribosylformylglycinamidine cyclo-ligase [Gracilibacillus halophilus]ENH96768.1 phosphoribosylaminoimidazole synthetase [Gracilibacillus halophilus YIM-C55.5]
MSEIYKNAGVDVEAGYQAVDLMKKHIAKTNRPEVIGGVGAFGGLFDLSGFSYEEPVLVSGTDGVGTKLKLAFEMDQHDTVGIDLVAMCVNDIVAQGADPLFFLDYIACGKNQPEKMEQIVKGISDGCEQSHAALIGGETAEMPDMYDEDEYDLAGFVVGICDKKDIITGDKIQPGDKMIGIGSSGVHSNGFSLVRKIVEENDLAYDDHIASIDRTLGYALLEPTKIYTKAIQQLKQNLTIKGISHITGGGFYENIPRAIPDHLGVQLTKGSWEVPKIFHYLQETANVHEEDMYGVFNMGIGMAVVVEAHEAEMALELLRDIDESASLIGEVTAETGVKLINA